MRILVIDDEKLLLDLVERRLALKSHEVTTAESASEAFLCLAKDRFDVILCDVHLPGMDGEKFVARLSPLHASRVVMMTADDSFPGADTLRKPFTIERLFEVVEAPRD